MSRREWRLLEPELGHGEHTSPAGFLADGWQTNREQEHLTASEGSALGPCSQAVDLHCNALRARAAN